MTANIVFSVASIIDASGEMDEQGTPVMPVLGFATSETRDELLLAELGYGIMDARVRARSLGGL